MHLYTCFIGYCHIPLAMCWCVHSEWCHREHCVFLYYAVYPPFCLLALVYTSHKTGIWLLHHAWAQHTHTHTHMPRWWSFWYAADPSALWLMPRIWCLPYECLLIVGVVSGPARALLQGGLFQMSALVLVL